MLKTKFFMAAVLVAFAVAGLSALPAAAAHPGGGSPGDESGYVDPLAGGGYVDPLAGGGQSYGDPLQQGYVDPLAHGRGNGKGSGNEKAFGRYCRTESNRHVEGERGTPRSQCVLAMAKLSSGKTHNPRRACAAESKKHLRHQHATPFSNCVSAGAKLLKDQHKHRR